MTASQRSAFLLACSVLVVATLAHAEVPQIALERVECLPEEDNGVMYATVAPEIGGTDTRLFFRWEEDEDFYYVLMNNEGGGRYWGVPAKPEVNNEAVEYYVAIVDAAEQVLAKSAAEISPVTDDCDVELTPKQRGVAENLTVGETTAEQIGLEVDGFLCDGVVSRINHEGILRGDEFCRACVIAWWEKKGLLLPIAGGGVITGIVIADDDPRTASPSGL
ncbi:MAG: hypothetical protein GY856_35895 [bacterium]|nr:hypothetical protein [bacterium]